MSGREYLQTIHAELKKGRNQWRKGANILEAFGYVRRRQSAIDEINAELKRVGLRKDLPIDTNMPLTDPYIRFRLEEDEVAQTFPTEVAHVTNDQVPELVEADSISAPLPAAFKVKNLAAAQKQVECVKPTDTVATAYTKMSTKDFSQLVVTDGSNALQTAIKGTVSYKTIATRFLHAGKAENVRECLDQNPPVVSSESDIADVMKHLHEHAAVLVVGNDKRLCGIVTAWDLMDEWADLVRQFQQIGYVETGITFLLLQRLDRLCILSCLAIEGKNPPLEKLEELELGDLLRVIQNPENWQKLGLPYDRVHFSSALDRIRKMRNQLMHFRGPLSQEQMTELNNFSKTVEQCFAPQPPMRTRSSHDA
ncbi:MAG: CBS domain-containing protein [Chloroflexi bacterium]|nr:CBS domain-containing protein [Chloroflexota bacterium]